MNTAEERKKLKDKIEIEMKRFFDEAVKIQRVPQLDPFLKRVRNFILTPGKRIRPIIMVESYRNFGGREVGKVIKASLCLEFFHTFALIIDDWMDKSSLRRWAPSLHTEYTKFIKEKSGISQDKAEHLGASMAIDMAIVLFSLAHLVLVRSKLSEKQIKTALELIAQTCVTTCYGEAFDLLLSFSKFKQIKEKDAIDVGRLKAAYYSVELPLILGAILAGVKDNSTLRILRKYALLVGSAFQIRDDILGIFGTEKEIGKPGDLEQGKKSVLVIKALEMSTDKQKKIILQNLGKENISESEIKKVKEVVKKTGALKYSQNLLENKVKRAKEMVEKSNLKSKNQKFLLELADILVNRLPPMD